MKPVLFVISVSHPSPDFPMDVTLPNIHPWVSHPLPWLGKGKVRVMFCSYVWPWCSSPSHWPVVSITFIVTATHIDWQHWLNTSSSQYWNNFIILTSLPPLLCHAILPHSIATPRAVPSREMKAALKVLNDSIGKPVRSGQQLTNALNIIQREWLKVRLPVLSKDTKKYGSDATRLFRGQTETMCMDKWTNP